MKLIQDAAYVASIEGDAPLGGFYPPLRDLIIRPAAGCRMGAL